MENFVILRLARHCIPCFYLAFSLFWQVSNTSCTTQPSLWCMLLAHWWVHNLFINDFVISYYVLLYLRKTTSSYYLYHSRIYVELAYLFCLFIYINESGYVSLVKGGLDKVCFFLSLRFSFLFTIKLQDHIVPVVCIL